jgi:hypothetical protein
VRSPEGSGSAALVAIVKAADFRERDHATFVGALDEGPLPASPTHQAREASTFLSVGDVRLTSA